jgi:hypothetical protein
MWNPRAHIEYDLLNIIHEAPNGYKPDFLIDNVYDGFDLLPLIQELPDDDIDVHAIAIATSNPEPTDIDHNWTENDNEKDIISNTTTTSTDTESTTPKPPSRRLLRHASELAFRKGSELFMGSSPLPVPAPNNDKKNNRSQRKLIRNRQLQGDVDNGDTPTANITNTATVSSTTTSKKTYGENDIVPGRGWVVSTTYNFFLLMFYY